MNIHTIGSDLADLATKVEDCRDSLVGRRQSLSNVINSAIIQTDKHRDDLVLLLGIINSEFDAHDAELAALIADVPVVQPEQK